MTRYTIKTSKTGCTGDGNVAVVAHGVMVPRVFKIVSKAIWWVSTSLCHCRLKVLFFETFRVPLPVLLVMCSTLFAVSVEGTACKAEYDVIVNDEIQR